MSRYMTRQRTSSETSPRKSLTRKTISKSEVTKPIARNNSVKKKVSKAKDNNETTDKKVEHKPRTKSGRSLTKRLSATSVKLGKNNIDEQKEKVTRHRPSRADNDKISAKTRKVTARNRTNESKDDNANKKKVNKKISKNVSSQRQMSLRESFLNHVPPKQLRSRRTPINYKDDSTLIESSLPLDKRDSVVVLQNINNKKEKVPVYKSIPLDEPVKNTQEIYDFEFDTNDSKEKLPKKRKKRLIKTGAVKRNVKKTVVKRNVKVEKTETKELAITEPVENNVKGNAKDKIRVPAMVRRVKNTSVRDALENVENIADISDVGDAGDKNNLVQSHSLDNENPARKKNNAVAPAKPLIKSIENLKENKVVLLRKAPIVNSEDFKPFRPTNIFDKNKLVPQDQAHNHSLFEKSLSPITRISYFDPGSPWRGPQISTFSQFRNVYQSTPQNTKCDVYSGRFIRAKSNDTKTTVNLIHVKDTPQNNNENMSMEKTVNVNNSKKEHSTGGRRFGTEITNLDHTVQFNTPAGEIIERTVVEAESPLANMQSASTASSHMNSVPMFDDEEDKENSVLNYQTPTNVLKKVSKKVKFRNPQEIKSKPQSMKTDKLGDLQARSPGAQIRAAFDKQRVSRAKTVTRLQKNLQDENVDPQPGPSGLQHQTIPTEKEALKQEAAIKLQTVQLEENLNPQPGPSGLQRQCVSNEPRVLRQSCLNNFLNLEEMPQSTTIQTSHGIFDDTYSSPISCKTAKKPKVSSIGIHNAFGFEEDYSSQNATPVKRPRRLNAKPQVPLRLSIGEIRNKLLPVTAKDDVAEKESRKHETATVAEPLADRKAKTQIDITNFSDTFDILSETGEEPSNVSECPLFTDLEPSHFTKPPKHSYKRKRAFAISFPNDSSDDGSDVSEHEVKRKRVGKMKKEEEKRLKEWVKNVNQTFSEIDQYDLHIE